MNLEIPVGEIAILVSVVVFFISSRFEARRHAELASLTAQNIRDGQIQSLKISSEISDQLNRLGQTMESVDRELGVIADTQKENLTFLHKVSGNNDVQHAKLITLLDQKLQLQSRQPSST